MIGVPVVQKRKQTRYATITFSMVSSMELVDVFWNPEFMEPKTVQLTEEIAYEGYQYNTHEYRQVRWHELPKDLDWYKNYFGAKPSSCLITPELVWPVDRANPLDFKTCYQNCLLRGAGQDLLRELYEKIYSEQNCKTIKSYRQAFPCGLR